MFAGFTGADFACYEPHKWRSNVYNRERMEVKQKLLALAKEVSGSLLGADGSPLFIEASVEHPALWNHKQVDTQSVFFSRHEAARKELDGIIDRARPLTSLLDDPTPQRNHLFLAITLGHETLELSVKLHPDASVDRRNLVAKLDEHYEGERFLGLLAELPPEYKIGVTPELEPVAENNTVESLAALLEKLPASGGMSLPGQPVHFFYVGTSLPRGEVIGQLPSPEAVIDWVRGGLLSLLPIYRYIAWSRDNDFVSMRQVLDKEKTARRQKGLHKNDRVRVVRGLLSGKDGVVQEVDAKGHVKVLVGKMVVKVDAADVERPE